MFRWKLRLLYFFIVPAVTAAAGILGYYTYQAASQFARLGEETIVQSMLLLVREKVDRVEQQIVSADNAIFELVDLESPEAIEKTWPRMARGLSPSVRTVMILDDSGNTLAFVTRDEDRAQKRRFRKIFFERILPDLELETQKVGQLRYLHRTYGDQSHLVSFRVARHDGRRHYVITHHDTQHFIRFELPGLFVTEEGKRLYNVIDENQRRVFGPSLAQAGDYLVGHRFPTTLYNWRLQVAPKQAPLLDAQGRTRRVNEVALVGTAFAIILLGVGFLIFAADKERRLNALKGEFIANVSHELKTPLSVIRMFGELLLTGRAQTESKQRQYLEIICRESERLSSLIENVLDFSALERGKRTYEMHLGDLIPVVTRGIETFRQRHNQDEPEVRFTPPDSLPPVRLDEQAILLALINLLDNALKYAKSPIEVSIVRRDLSVEVRVRDYGPGIPNEDLKRVFERFYRGRRAGAARGSGIGLSIVRHIAEAHGGRAWAENEKDGGAAVIFSLPIVRTHDERLPDVPENVPSEPPPTVAPTHA